MVKGGKGGKGSKGSKGGGKSFGSSFGAKKPSMGKVDAPHGNPFDAASKKDKAGAKVNPFEARNNGKAKHEVLNRRVKGGERNVAKARADATAKRSRTLLLEHKNRRSANTLLDRRFGEGDADMTPEERAYARFKKERQRRSKADGVFSLNDDAAGGGFGGDLLTHGGQSLAAVDFAPKGRGDADGMWDGGSDDDGDDKAGQMDKAYIEEMHFGGGTLSAVRKDGAADAGPRSKKDVLEEMIARSKEQKREKKKSKEAQDDGVSKLDKEYDELAALLDFRPKEPTRKERAEQEKAEMAEEAEAAALGPLQALLAKQGKGEKLDKPKVELDEYERAVRALAFASRSKPCDRTKTPAEVNRALSHRAQTFAAATRIAFAGMARPSSATPSNMRLRDAL